MPNAARGTAGAVAQAAAAAKRNFRRFISGTRAALRPRGCGMGDEHRRGLRVSQDLLVVRIPADLAAGAQRNIRQVAGGRDLVALLDIGNRPLARFDAIEEIARVQIELFAGGTRHLEMAESKVGARLWNASGPPAGCPVKTGIAFWAGSIFMSGINLETRRDRSESTFAAEKLEPPFAAAVPRLTSR